jgi:hypothetical protein
MTVSTLHLDALRVEARRIRAYAEKPENFYHPGKEAPGYDENFIAETEDGLRVVYSITIDTNGKAWKHLSISYRDGLPGIVVVNVIARMFGFTQPINENVNLAINEKEYCYAVVEPYAPQDTTMSK